VGQFFQAFWNDGKVDVLVILIFVDFVLGVLAALKTKTFRLSYVADFLRKDVVFKIGGYLVLYAASYFAGQADIVIDGLDMGVVAGAAYVVIVAAMVGSILNSLAELGLRPGNDPTPPPTAPVQGTVVKMLTADEGV
jgi:hypothetical protein